MKQTGELKLTSITYKDGTPRTDGRYPLRVGRTCTLYYQIGTVMLIYWCKDQNGENYRGVLRTSRVEKEAKEDGKLIIETMNTIYTFEPVQ